MLLALAAMLIITNALAWYIRPVPQQTPPVWFGPAIMEPTPPAEDGSAQFVPIPVVELGEASQALNGRPVPLTAAIGNTGRTAYLNEAENCLHGCLPSPWYSMLEVRAATNIGRVFDAVRQLREACNVDVTVYVASRRQVITVFFADTSAALSFGFDTTTDTPRPGETLDQFGERTGCARISPLRP